MNRPSDGGAKVLVNAYAGSNKAQVDGRTPKSKAKPSGQSKNVPDSRCSETGGGGSSFHSFFRWFRRDESRVLARSASGSAVAPELHDRSTAQPRSPAASIERSERPAKNAEHNNTAGSTSGRTSTRASRTPDTVSQSASNGTHSSSPSPGPVIDCSNLSKSSSCDSVLSTATNGFAFVPPNCYEAVLAGANPPASQRRTIQPGPYTDSYKRRCTELDRARELDRRYELTLRKKYRLFASLRDSPAREQRDTPTLTRDSQRTMYADLSLPTTGGNKSITSTPVNGEAQNNLVDPASRRHRRTVSDSSKDRRAGAYVHVKGKRRAPPPPSPQTGLSLDRSDTGSISSSSITTTGTLTRSGTPNYRTLSPGSTLSRKKRPAPAPPTTILNEANSSTSLLEDREIKAIIEGRPLSLAVPTEHPTVQEEPTLIMPLPYIRPLSPLPNIAEERAPPGGLTEEQKQQLIDNIRRVQTQAISGRQAAPDTPPTPTNEQCDVMQMEEQFNRANGTRSPIHDYLYAEAMAKSTSAQQAQPQQPQPPTSPISPRPWYKRPISGMRHQESSLPFKRDIILKTIDKRKGKETADDLPEVGYCRNSIVQQDGCSATAATAGPSTTGGKFNLFAKITEKSDDTKRRERDGEKRRSAIGIPSISELDREAAEIVHNEYRCSAGTERTQSLEGQQQSADKQKSTKELISKFEATSVPVAGKLTVSSSFVARKEYFGLEPAKVSPTAVGTSATPATTQSIAIVEKAVPAVQPITSGGGSKTTTPSTTTNGLATVGSDKNLLGLWTCPYCTLENPNWRIICEACERIKPYDSKLSILEEPPLRPNHPLKRPIPEVKKRTNGEDVDKKTERVLKYFMPKSGQGAAVPATNGTLLVGGVVNGEDRASLVQRKPSHAKPLASPKMGVKSLMNRQDSATGVMYRNFNAIAESYHQSAADGGGSNKFDDQKLKESHGNGGVGPVAPLASPEPTAEREDAVYGVVSKAYSPKDRVNIEEIRNARIARFGMIVEPGELVEQPVVKEVTPPPNKTKEQQDQEALEKEKERLREMIRAMNAKALAEKYPVVQKPPSNGGGSLKRDSPLVQRKNGLTSGIPISTKSLSPVPMRKIGSPLMARKASPTMPEDTVRKEQQTVPSVELAPISSPNTGAIRKTSFPRRTSDGGEGKIINQDGLRGTIPETVAEINQQPAPATLVLTNDVQALHYEPMDEQQFACAAGGSRLQGPTNAELSSIPRPSGVPLSPRLQDRHRKTLMEKQQHDEKLKQLSVQLRSQQGVDRFRSTLLYSPNNISKTGTLALNKLLRNLEQAIGDGAHDRAAELAMDLAKMKVSLSVTRQSPGRPNSSASGSLTDISLNVYIDDKVSHKGPIRMTMASFATLAQLKAKLSNEYQLPVAVQRWRCDDQPLEDDARTLYDYGIQTSDRTLYVYIVQPPIPAREPSKPPPLVKQQNFSSAEIKLLSVSSESDGEHSDTQNDETVLGAAALPTASPRGAISKPKSEALVEKPSTNGESGWACHMCTLINPLERPGCAACSEARPNHLRPDSPAEQITVTPEDLTRYLDQQPPLAPGRKTKELTVHVQLRNNPPCTETRNDLNRISSNRKSSDIFNILHEESKAVGAITSPAVPPIPKPRTTSELIRPEHIQVPEQNRIVMSTAVVTHRSPNITRSQYRGVDNFNPNSSGMAKPERPMITTASPIVRAVLLKGSSGDKTPHAVRFGRNGLALPEDGSEVLPNHYTELVNLDNADLIANIEPFECPICFGAFQPYEGIVLRDCLHSFCKQCLISTIQYSEDAAIRCPYSDAVYSCESVIQQREIKALVSKELYEAHLAKSIQQAESTIDNTFHCRTPNCRGWCIFEDNVNQFKCPVCRIVNCLTCRVIHDGLDCKQYQDRMNSDCDTNLEARRTKAMLQEMIEKGEALNCPTCQVIVMKKWGCDWLKCSMCKTEICWVTRGHRWGPAGKGDTTGGCRCGVNGIKCHPKCNYCH